MRPATITVRPVVEGAAPHWPVEVLGAGGERIERRMPAKQVDHDHWPAPESASLRVTEFRDLADAVRSGQADAQTGLRYGRYLFEALIGADLWPELKLDDGVCVVQLILPTGLLQGLVWELMHDDTEYLALRAAGPLVLPRVVREGSATLRPLDRAPRVLFAVGSRLDDPDVQAGAEVMAVLRNVARQGNGAVSTRVLSSATLSSLDTTCDDFEPDVVHLIGHGRWDRVEKQGLLTLRSESVKEGEECGAAQLAAALGTATLGTPTLVVLSACDAAASSGTPPAAVATATAGTGAPMAAELAGRGIPVVVAMAGTIGDTSCRIFARSVVKAVTGGGSLFAALARGRAAVHADTPADTVDWALPTVFTHGVLDETFRLTNTAASDRLATAVRRHAGNTDPLFVGRHEILTDLDDLLGSGDPTAILLMSEYGNKVGGTRLLRELAAATVQAGHLPILCGEVSEAEGITSFPKLAGHIVKTMYKIAASLVDFDEPSVPTATLGLCGVTNPAQIATVSGVDTAALIRALRKDMLWLRDAAHAADPTVFDPAKAPVLLIDDVHNFGAEPGEPSLLQQLLEEIGPGGFGDGRSVLPVVLFGHLHRASGPELGSYRNRHIGKQDRRFIELRQLTDLPAGHLAFLSWLLNPAGGQGWPQKTATPTGNPATWTTAYRLAMMGRKFYDADLHRAFLDGGVAAGFLVKHDDNALLRTIGMAG